MATTMKDVAKVAKVSPSTISRVINHPYMVRKETRERVLKAMEECDYSYNALAGALSSQKTRTLGLIIPTITNPIFSVSTRGVQDMAATMGFSVLVGNTDYNDASEESFIGLFQSKQVDGIILTGARIKDRILRFLRQKNIPFVITWSTHPDPDIDCVSFDNCKSAYKAVDYLINLGHKRIAMIAGKFKISDRAQLRWEGYKKRLGDAGIRYREDYVIQCNYTPAEGMAAMHRFLRMKDRPTAVFCGNDILAIGAMRAVRESGLKVPDDVSICGFDDMDVSAYIEPALTTVRVPAYKMGSMAAELLISKLKERKEGRQHLILDTDLVIRDSCKRLS